MPFKCEYVIPETGVQIEHWQEAELVYNMKTGYVVFTLEGYFNKAAYDNGLQPVITKFYEIPEGSQPQLAAAGKSFLLGYVRALPEFERSEDVT